MALGKFCLRDTAGGPERARWLHLARSGSQSQRAIWFILPARGASHINKMTYLKNSGSPRWRIQDGRNFEKHEVSNTFCMDSWALLSL